MNFGFYQRREDDDQRGEMNFGPAAYAQESSPFNPQQPFKNNEASGNTSDIKRTISADTSEKLFDSRSGSYIKGLQSNLQELGGVADLQPLSSPLTLSFSMQQRQISDEMSAFTPKKNEQQIPTVPRQQQQIQRVNIPGIRDETNSNNHQNRPPRVPNLARSATQDLNLIKDLKSQNYIMKAIQRTLTMTSPNEKHQSMQPFKNVIGNFSPTNAISNKTVATDFQSAMLQQVADVSKENNSMEMKASQSSNLAVPQSASAMTLSQFKQPSSRSGLSSNTRNNRQSSSNPTSSDKIDTIMLHQKQQTLPLQARPVGLQQQLIAQKDEQPPSKFALTDLSKAQKRPQTAIKPRLSEQLQVPGQQSKFHSTLNKQQQNTNQQMIDVERQKELLWRSSALHQGVQMPNGMIVSEGDYDLHQMPSQQYQHLQYLDQPRSAYNREHSSHSRETRSHNQAPERPLSQKPQTRYHEEKIKQARRSLLSTQSNHKPQSQYETHIKNGKIQLQYQQLQSARVQPTELMRKVSGEVIRPSSSSGQMEPNNLYSNLQLIKKQNNKYLEKLNKQKTRIGYLEKEVAERDKVMHNYVLNTEDQKNLQSRCLIQSYKSKLATLEKKLESLKRQNKELKKENKELSKSEENEKLMRNQVSELQSQKDYFFDECVRMSHYIFHNREDMLQQQMQQQQIDQDEQQQNALMNYIQTHPQSNEIINIGTYVDDPHVASNQIALQQSAMFQPHQAINTAFQDTSDQDESHQSSMPPHFNGVTNSDGYSAQNEIEMLKKQLSNEKMIRDEMQDQINLLSQHLPQFVYVEGQSQYEVQPGNKSTSAQSRSESIGSRLIQEEDQNNVKEQNQYPSEEQKDGNSSAQKSVKSEKRSETPSLTGKVTKQSTSPEKTALQEREREKNEKFQVYFEALRQKIIEQENTLFDFKRELQRLYAPKVKIILQSIALQENDLWNTQDKENKTFSVENAQKLLSEYFYLCDKVMDEPFFKKYLSDYEPVFHTELPKMTQQILHAIHTIAQQSKVTSEGGKLADQVGSVHRVISLADLQIEDSKLGQFAKYLAHQTLKSEDKLSVEVMGVDVLNLDEVSKQLLSHRSTQDSERIDSQAIQTLVCRLYQSHTLDVFLKTINIKGENDINDLEQVTISLRGDSKQVSTDQIDEANTTVQACAFVDIGTFRQILNKVSQSVEEERAQEQLINLLKVRRIGENLIDLVELKKLMSGVKTDFEEGQLSPPEESFQQIFSSDQKSIQQPEQSVQSSKQNSYSNNKLIVLLREFLLRLGLEHWIGNMKKQLQLKVTQKSSSDQQKQVVGIEVLTEERFDQCIQLALRSLQAHQELQLSKTSNQDQPKEPNLEWLPTQEDINNFKMLCNLKNQKLGRFKDNNLSQAIYVVNSIEKIVLEPFISINSQDQNPSSFNSSVIGSVHNIITNAGSK